MKRIALSLMMIVSFLAHAEDQDMRCFRNFKSKIETLENYTVTFSDAPAPTPTRKVSAKSNDSLKLRLISAPKSPKG